MKLIHTDIVNNNINVGDYVISYLRNTLQIFIVEKLGPKMIRLTILNKSYNKSIHRYPHDLMVIDSKVAIFKILQDSK